MSKVSGIRGIRIAHALAVLIPAAFLALVMLLAPLLLALLRNGPRARIRIDLPRAPRSGSGIRARADQIVYAVLFRFVVEEQAVAATVDAHMVAKLLARQPHRRPGDGTRARAEALASTAARQLSAARAAGDEQGELELIEALRAAELWAAASETCSEPVYVDEETAPAEVRSTLASIEPPPKPPVEPRALVRSPRAPGRVAPA